jgi:hypothetical protein
VCKKSEYLGSDPKLFASQVGSGSKKLRRKWDLDPDLKKNSFGSTTLLTTNTGEDKINVKFNF